MSAGRVRINWPAIHELLKSAEIAALVEDHTRRIDQKAIAQGCQTRTDFAASGDRPRGAVIVGYEQEASAANSRRVLLGSLDG